MRGRTSSFFFGGMSIIPLKKEPVKCKGLCALSAPSSLDTVMIICNFVVVSGENFLRIYTQDGKESRGLNRNFPKKKNKMYCYCMHILV